jgi:hypothetical protein
MSRILYTTQNLVDEVRSLLDEQNADSVDTTLDILPSLNRAQDFAFDVYARVYPEPILQPVDFPITGGVADYAIPEDVFEDRILKIEFQVNGSYRECQRISYRDISNYESASVTNMPAYYCIFGRTIRFISTPSGTYNARLWQLRNPEQLVLPQGRITKINTTSNYVILDEAGSDLTTESDQLGSYVNWIDGQTGEIRATLQIASLNEDKVQFRPVPARSSVLNRTVTGSIPTTAGEDDYLCSIAGICVPYYGRPTGNFMIGYSVAELSELKLGGPEGAADKLVTKFEQQVERSWVGRERQMRIQKRSQNWGVPSRRWYFD